MVRDAGAESDSAHLLAGRPGLRALGALGDLPHGLSELLLLGVCAGSPLGFGQFHLGMIETAEGEMLPIGKITFDTSHAPLTADLRAAARHYDDTGSVGAFVRARDGQHGVSLSGVLPSHLIPE